MGSRRTRGDRKKMGYYKQVASYPVGDRGISDKDLKEVQKRFEDEM